MVATLLISSESTDGRDVTKGALSPAPVARHPFASARMGSRWLRTLPRIITMPLTRIPPGRVRLLAVPVFVVYLFAWLPFLLVGEPDEMVRLQFAGSESRAYEIVAGWSPTEAVDMAFLQGVDEVHLLAYGVLLAAAAVWAGRQFRGRAGPWAPLVAWMALAAALFDAIENVGMIVMIRGDVGAPVPTITTTFAVAKISMIFVVVPYVVAGLVARLRSRRGLGDC